MKYFLASVGNAELLERVDGNLQLFASARTLTDSALSFTSSMEEVRAGQGAKLYGRFNHSTGMTVQLTDAMFDLSYISAQVGADIEKGGSALKQDTGAAVTEDTITITKDIANVGNGCGLAVPVIWYKARGCGQDAVMYAFEVEKTTGTNTYKRADGLKFPVVSDAEGYCVYYFTEDPSARSTKITGSFNPKELVLLLTANLFAGDASHPESGKPVGSITVKVPRFQLDGAFDLSMAMTSAASTNLNGTALIADDNSCEGDGVYAEIVEVITGRTFDLAYLMFENGDEGLKVSDLKVGAAAPSVYAIYTDRTTELLDPTEITSYGGTCGAEISTTTGKVTTAASDAGTLTATKDGVTATIQVVEG